ncbi:YesK family protein [Sinobaca sp. H24]|uniref:YesK family protein n=1 Tax=Sinobaca sp. H24 TaxID=2923376 RepID=UPI0020797A33|nr:YesK family protein [Sinobaca sp. H24]
MLVFGPLLDAVIIGSILLLLTVILRMLNTSRFIMMIPVILINLSALAILYWSYEFIRGFEGMGVAFLSFFLLLFSIPSWGVAIKKRKTSV